MIKLFAWEPHVLQDIYQKREDELVQVKKGRILDVAINSLNSLLPLCAKLATISVYVRLPHIK